MPCDVSRATCRSRSAIDENMDLIIKNLPLFGQGLERTFYLAVLTLCFATVISAAVGIASITRLRILRVLALIYVEFLRSITLVVNVLFAYFGAALIGISPGPFHAAIVSLSLWGAANGGEHVRGGSTPLP